MKRSSWRRDRVRGWVNIRCSMSAISDVLGSKAERVSASVMGVVTERAVSVKVEIVGWAAMMNPAAKQIRVMEMCFKARTVLERLGVFSGEGRGCVCGGDWN